MILIERTFLQRFDFQVTSTRQVWARMLSFQTDDASSLSQTTALTSYRQKIVGSLLHLLFSISNNSLVVKLNLVPTLHMFSRTIISMNESPNISVSLTNK
jgi:hypothetical protein